MTGVRGIDAPLVLATRNRGKLRELEALFAAAHFAIQSLADVGVAPTPDEDALESHATFAENALAKARWFHARTGGRVVVADDSGLCVDALCDAPGVHSKRWSAPVLPADADVDVFNNSYVLEQLTRAALEGRASRRARYVCAAACVWHDGECVAIGETHGEIMRTPTGAHGFGYDPLFRADDLAATFGEVTHARKALVSHRGRAFRALLPMLPFAVDPRGLAG